MQRSNFYRIFKYNHSIYQRKPMYSPSKALVSTIHILKTCKWLEGDGEEGEKGVWETLWNSRNVGAFAKQIIFRKKTQERRESFNSTTSCARGNLFMSLAVEVGPAPLRSIWWCKKMSFSSRRTKSCWRAPVECTQRIWGWSSSLKRWHCGAGPG